jgi:hypothetical protein
MSSWRRFIYAWIVSGGYFVGTILLIVLQGLLDYIGLVSYTASLIPFLVLHLLLLACFFVGLRWSSNPPAYRQVLKIGVPATGRVLRVQPTRWKQRRMLGPWKREYLLEIEVLRPDTTPYSAKLAVLVARNEQPPAVDDMLAIKVHPRHPAIVVPGEAHTDIVVRP